ncbi:single-stranded DNA-binding protein [Acidobacteria bacterium Mor1]|nr:single-stranded DNA-binding protein [Acidobacteria bacterium Mor1]
MPALTETAERLSRRVARMRFAEPVTHVYNPLRYAWEPHSRYLKRYGKPGKEALFLGMNPGPFGMAQTGVPFGEVSLVRDWLGIDGEVKKPRNEHPKRPIDGFGCTRSEVSGQRLWGWARERFGDPEPFFARFFVYNYCPLVFMESTGRNRTPDKLPAAERDPLFRACDEALVRVVERLRPEWLIGVGGFAEKRAREVLADTDVKIGRILHPSPASPAANRGWGPQAEADLTRLGIAVP